MKILPPKGVKPDTSEKPGLEPSAQKLGTSAKSSPPPTEKMRFELAEMVRRKRRDFFDLHHAARKLVCARGTEKGLLYPATYHRVAECRWQMLGDYAAVQFSNEGRAYLNGLVTCGSVWACPMCTAVIQEGRRKEIAEAMAWAYGPTQNLQPVMVTFTFPHKEGQSLAELLERQAKAFKFLRQGAKWERFKVSIGYQGLIRSLELTYGQNGWHPHTHELFFVSHLVEAEALQVRLTELWESACVRAGLLDRNDVVQMYNFGLHAVDVKGWCSDSDYLAKQDDSRHWGVDREMAKGSTKAGRAKGQHPFGLLANAAAGDVAAGEKYLEYIETMKGKRQLFWSHGLKARVGIEEHSDDELADELDPSQVLSCLFDRVNWYRTLRLKKRAILMEMAEDGFKAGGIEGAKAYLAVYFAALYGIERGS
jgi:hypothetical protein